MKRRKLIKYAAVSLIMARITPLALSAKTRMVVAPSPYDFDSFAEAVWLELKKDPEIGQFMNIPFSGDYAKERLNLYAKWSTLDP